MNNKSASGFSFARLFNKSWRTRQFGSRGAGIIAELSAHVETENENTAANKRFRKDFMPRFCREAKARSTVENARRQTHPFHTRAAYESLNPPPSPDLVRAWP